MKIELAKSYGFCYGVKRAIDIAEKNPKSVTFGPIIHNKDEINRLANNHNVGLVESLDEALEHDTVIIRTHGITKDRLQRLKADGKKVINATCPYVTTPQQIVEKMSQEGYTIVIFGDEKHPEIQGVASYSVAAERTFTVLDKSELSALPLGAKVALVAQTTRKPDAYQAIAAELVVRVQELRVFNTICNATFENQEATEELAKKSDIMIIIGGKNSSNTKQLFSICQNNLESCYHIENSSELEASWFAGKENCGITAGASTPGWIIEDVTKKIKELTLTR